MDNFIDSMLDRRAETDAGFEEEQIEDGVSDDVVEEEIIVNGNANEAVEEEKAE